MAKKVAFYFLLFTFLCSVIFADEDFEFAGAGYNTMPALYIGPLSRVFPLGLLLEEPMLFLSSTIEYPLNGFHALIVNPSIYLSLERGGGNKYSKLGSGVGIRHFLNGEANGFYLQLMPSVYYGRAAKNYLDEDNVYASSTIIDILGYVGYSAKGILCPKCYKIFFDVGTGYGWSTSSDVPIGPLNLGYAGHKGISVDMNLGIEYEFQSHPDAVVANKNLEVNKKISVYMHPISLLTGLYVEEAPLIFYLTGEYPLNEFYSLIVSPSLWTGGNDKWMEGSDYFKLGSGIGIRRFIYGEASGHYLQLMPSAHYLKYQAWNSDDVKRKVSGSKFDIIGYIGYSAKYYYVSMFFEAGMGYDFSKSLTFDANMGFGFPF